MQFVWNMSETQYKNLIADHNAKGSDQFSIDADIYGQCRIGTLCADIQHSLDEDNWYAFANVYALGVDEGYGETESGIPYTLLNDGPAVPMDAKSFDEFKAQFERNFEEHICASEYTKSLANQPLGNWD